MTHVGLYDNMNKFLLTGLLDTSTKLKNIIENLHKENPARKKQIGKAIWI